MIAKLATISVILAVSLASADDVFVNDADSGGLDFGGKEMSMFDLDLSKDLPSGWKLTDLEIVDEMKKNPDKNETSTDDKNSTTDGSNSTMVKVLVNKYDGNDPQKVGKMEGNLTLTNTTRFTFKIQMKVVGYNLSIPGYFRASEKPYVEIKLIPKETKEERSASSMVMRQLGMRAARNPMEIFDFDDYGLNFKANEWITITYTLDISRDSANVGSYTMAIMMRGSEKPQEKGVIVKSLMASCRQIPKNNEQIRKDYMATTTTSATTTVSSSTTESTTTKPDVPTPEGSTSRIFASKGAEVFVIILLVILFIGFGILGYRYYVVNQKLREYKVERAAAGNPNYDNPMYSGSHTSADRMNR